MMNEMDSRDSDGILKDTNLICESLLIATVQRCNHWFSTMYSYDSKYTRNEVSGQ